MRVSTSRAWVRTVMRVLLQGDHIGLMPAFSAAGSATGRIGATWTWIPSPESLLIIGSFHFVGRRDPPPAALGPPRRYLPSFDGMTSSNAFTESRADPSHERVRRLPRQ